MKRFFPLLLAACSPFGGAADAMTSQEPASIVDTADAAVVVASDGSSPPMTDAGTMPPDDAASQPNDAGTPVADASDGACALVTHDNGKGQHWQDCVAYGTHDVVQAMKACAAYDAGSCASSSGGCGGGTATVNPNGVGILWEYQGGATGHVNVTTNACPLPADPEWN